MCLFFASRRRDTRWPRDWSSDVCSSDLESVHARLADRFVELLETIPEGTDQAFQFVRGFIRHATTPQQLERLSSWVQIGRASCRESVRQRGGAVVGQDKCLHAAGTARCL